MTQLYFPPLTDNRFSPDNGGWPINGEFEIINQAKGQDENMRGDFNARDMDFLYPIDESLMDECGSLMHLDSLEWACFELFKYRVPQNFYFFGNNLWGFKEGAD